MPFLLYLPLNLKTNTSVMLRFFGNILSTVLGVFIASFIGILILIGIVASQSEQPSPYIRDNTVLKIQLKSNLGDRVVVDPFDELMNPNKAKLSLDLLRSNLPKASKDDRIKGIYLDISSVGGSWANMKEARDLLIDFKKSGKFIYAYTNDMGYSEGAYYLASAADKVMSPPETFFEFDGFYTQGEFYKKLFDKVGVKPEITRYGKYKSAIEPYIRTGFSKESKEQLEALLATNVQEFTSAIAESRGLSIKTVNDYMNETPDMSVKKALERNLVDTLIYPSDFELELKKALGVKAKSKLNQVSLNNYNLVTLKDEEETSSNKVAIIYAEGIIMPEVAKSPYDEAGYVSFEDIEKAFDAALDDKNVKAIVLRVNSPGGSGSTADLMWHKIKSASEKIPVIASMGGYAASGGYYIAVAADTIFADPTTITGSIGVFSTKFNLEELAETNIGVTFDEVKTHQHADWLNPFNSFSKEEDGAFQLMVNQFYDTFLDRVDEGRLLNRDEIHALAQGRVWSGVDAKSNGLVDVLGSLGDAIEFAAKKGGLDDYSTVSFPKPKTLVEKLFAGANQTMLNTLGINKIIGSKAYFTIMQEMQVEQHRPMIHALMPLEIKIK